MLILNYTFIFNREGVSSHFSNLYNYLTYSLRGSDYNGDESFDYKANFQLLSHCSDLSVNFKSYYVNPYSNAIEQNNPSREIIEKEDNISNDYNVGFKIDCFQSDYSIDCKVERKEAAETNIFYENNSSEIFKEHNASPSEENLNYKFGSMANQVNSNCFEGHVVRKSQLEKEEDLEIELNDKIVDENLSSLNYF